MKDVVIEDDEGAEETVGAKSPIFESPIKGLNLPTNPDTQEREGQTKPSQEKEPSPPSNIPSGEVDKPEMVFS